jgi:choline dehydrogenase
MSDADFDYIVIGSGAGGGPLAARLAEAERPDGPGGYTVLLLEAGGEEEPWNYQVPVFHGSATEDEELRLDHYVRHYADEARQARDPKYVIECNLGRHGVYYPRAHTRRLYRALRDDHHPASRQRLADHPGRHR